METGIVVDNFDPTYGGRCKIRVYGRHTETVCGKYVILDDDLPWAKPTETSGNFNVPKVGQRVYVEVIDPFTILYSGPVGVGNSVKQVFLDNAEDCENARVVLMEGKPGDNGKGDYVKIYYVPENGLNIEANGNKILLTKNDGLSIIARNGVTISIDNSTKDVSISTEGNVNLNCNNVNLTQDATEKLILGSKLMEKFNNHTHLCPGGKTMAPITKINSSDFSKKIKIG